MSFLLLDRQLKILRHRQILENTRWCPWLNTHTMMDQYPIVLTISKLGNKPLFIMWFRYLVQSQHFTRRWVKEATEASRLIKQVHKVRLIKRCFNSLLDFMCTCCWSKNGIHFGWWCSRIGTSRVLSTWKQLSWHSLLDWRGTIICLSIPFGSDSNAIPFWHWSSNVSP